jgi:hypothetical protein
MTSAKQFASTLLTLYGREKVQQVIEHPPTAWCSEWGRYASDPVGFGTEVLGETFTADVCQVMESVRDNVVTIAKSANATGKTHCAARVATWFYSIWDDSQVYTTAAPPLDNLQRLLWGEIGFIIRQHPNLFAGHRIRTLHVARSPKSFLTGVAIPTSGRVEQREAKFAGKHAPHILFIVDEGDAVPPEVYRGIESCMSGGHARLLVMFNPRARVGPVWVKERERQAHIVQLSALDHPNVRSGEGQIPGAVTRETVVRRLNQWSRPLAGEENPDAECVEVPGFLVGVVALALDGTPYPPLPPGWRKVTDPALWYMVLGRYPAAGAAQLISRAWVDAARSRWDVYVAQFGEVPPEGTQPVLGQDVAEFGMDQNVSCLRYGGWVAPFVTWGGVDTIATGHRAIALYNECRAAQAFVDATGVGAGVAPQMTRAGAMAVAVKTASKPTQVTEVGEFAILRDQLWWMVREWLRTDPGAMLPPDELLIEELTMPTYDTMGGKVRITKKKTMREVLQRSPDRADALCLTFGSEAGLHGSAHARGVI